MNHSNPPCILLLRSVFAGCLLLVVTAPHLSAREVRAIYLAGSGEPLAKVHLVGAPKGIELELPQRNFSPEVALPQGDLLLAALASPPAEGEEIPEGAPRVLIPAEWQRCILIFLGDPDNSVFPARIIPVNASALDFPKGSTLVYNLSDATIEGKFGAEQIVLKPGKAGKFKAPVRDFGSYPVAIDCIPQEETASRAICRSMWQHDPAARQILFIIPQKGQVIPRVWGTLDYQIDKQANGSASATD